MNGPTAPPSAPDRAGDACFWAFRHGHWSIRFYGRQLAGVAEAVEPALARAWLRQKHGRQVVRARPGACGEGDALIVESSTVAAAIATADCVPVAILGAQRAVLVHAGWRGIAARIIEAAIDEIRASEAIGAGGPPEDLQSLHAIIGPAIGACCYEVGEEVAAAIVEATGSTRSLLRDRGVRPYLDLQGAVRRQLERLRVPVIDTVAVCTRCHPRWLWSYRRDGPGAGRNWALLWRAGAGG